MHAPCLFSACCMHGGRTLASVTISSVDAQSPSASESVNRPANAADSLLQHAAAIDGRYCRLQVGSNGDTLRHTPVFLGARQALCMLVFKNRNYVQTHADLKDMVRLCLTACILLLIGQVQSLDNGVGRTPAMGWNR